ncbi:MAG TPA: hypothetical protein VN037_00860 [Verrucomicrobiae bacterium]|nr:hypothetical protein [Verrucomicrobiae bacterium]
MMLAALLLLSPFPLLENVDLPVSNPTASTAIVAQLPETTSPALTQKEFTPPNTSAPAAPSEGSLPSSPQPKANSDAGASFAEPHAFPSQPVKSAVRHNSASRNEKITWYSLMIVEHAGAVLDAWSTRRDLSRNFGTEGDPLMRPFAHSRTIYVATQVTPLLMDILGRRMMTSERPWVHKLWWVPQSAMASVSIEAGAHNILIAP